MPKTGAPLGASPCRLGALGDLAAGTGDGSSEAHGPLRVADDPEDGNEGCRIEHGDDEADGEVRQMLDRPAGVVGDPVFGIGGFQPAGSEVVEAPVPEPSIAPLPSRLMTRLLLLPAPT